ncbi:MAG: CcmD family protein [Actinomycetota bacterium]|nr:CcmD family protein [Actinomycetota bacterium]
MSYVLAAYFAAWLLLFLYVSSLEMRAASLRRDLNRLKEGIKDGRA